jgi:hypothetical protein
MLFIAFQVYAITDGQSRSGSVKHWREGAMTLNEAIDQIVDRGIAECRKVYRNSAQKLDATIKGFEACRGKTVEELKELLSASRTATATAREAARDVRMNGSDPLVALHQLSGSDGLELRQLTREKASQDYWWYRYYELQVEWVCNVLSAILQNQGWPVIVTPTVRGAMAAANIVGVGK